MTSQFIARLWSGLSILALIAMLLPAHIAEAYSGLDVANYDPDTVYVVQASSDTYFDKIAEAIDETADDLTLSNDKDSYIFIGFEEPFHGISLDFTTGQEGYIENTQGGQFDIEYYATSGGWSSFDLIDDEVEGSNDLTNTNGNVDDSDYFSFTWDEVPSNWNNLSLVTSNSKYYVRIHIEDDYSQTAYAGQIGVITYNLAFTLSDELGDSITGLTESDFEITGGDSTIHHFRETDGVYEFALDATEPEFSYTVSPDGYVSQSGEVSLDQGQTLVELEGFEYTHKFLADDGVGNEVVIDSMDLSDVECEISGGLAYCPVGVDNDDLAVATVYSSGYPDTMVNLEDRTAGDDAQVIYYVAMVEAEEEPEPDPETDPEGEEETEGLSDAADADLDCAHDYGDIYDHFGEQAICLVSEAGQVDALSEGEYGPNEATTRVDFLKLALLNAGYEVEAVEGVEYDDVDEDDEAYKWVSFATDMDFVHGYEDGTFRPDAEINRVEALIMILKIAGVEETEVPDEDLPFDDVFSDDWFAWVVHAGVDYGLVQGYEDGSFKPGNDITRAEMAVVARRVYYSFYVD